ncbi:MAG TPA: hypothetical protein VHR65_02245 [Solirubrobacterales bacterium]|nr:hypothetical protein [Solirubrobacterales bacterium]
MALVLALASGGTALALRLQVGDVTVVTGGGFSPTTLPKHEFAPIKLHGFGKFETTDGSPPPILKQLTIWFDKHGAVETRGLPVCTMAKLAATTTSQARKLCPGAIVGKGFGKAVINFPEQAPIAASSPITIFNGPKKDGNPTVLAHAHLTVPGPTTFVVPIEIQKVHDGRYGFKTVAEIPRIAGGYGTPIYGRLTIGKTWKYKGKTLSYANASCPDGHLQAKGQFTFKDGTFLQGTLVEPCKGEG